MFDKYSKRNTKSMSNKRNCLKHLFLISLIAMLFASCSPSAPKPNETASVRIEVLSLSTASIVPGTPNPTKYILELIPPEGNGESIKSESESGTFSISEVPIGTYTVKITAYDGKNAILEGETSLTVKPNSENKATVILNYLLTGSGVLSVTINWTGLTANNQVYTAIHDYKALGFRAVYAEGSNKDKSINGINDPENEKYIFWVDTDKLTSGSYEYRIEGLEPTSGTAIVFQIYTKINESNQLIAETFPTVMQIYDGLVSKPDQNEGQNFKLDANHIISYLENVTVSKDDVKPNADSPSTAIDITWTNPTSLDADNMPFYVLVTAIDNADPSKIFSEESDSYNEAGGKGSVTITGLTENHIYNIKFQVIGKEGYSNNTQLLTGVQPKIVVEKIEFVNLFKDSYTMGGSITIEGKVSPDNASNKDYKITITDGSEVNKEIAVTASTTSEQRTFKFETSGNYRITLTADDNGKDVSKEIKVKLATPTNLQYVEEPNESGITISWKPVESAEGYKVIRVIDGVDSSTEIDAQTAVTYTDKDVDSGHTYAYKVYAYRTDNTLNSLPTEATSTVNVSNADIIIKFPEGTLNLTGIFEGLQDKTIRLGTEDKIELTIAKDFAPGTTYEWILNSNFENPILKGNFNDASSITIDENTKGLKKYPDNAPNDLTLRVKDSSGKELGSITGTFTVINNNSAGKLMEIKAPGNLTNNTVYYEEPIQLEAIFANENAVKPALTWSSKNPEVMSVDKTGLVTTHQKGEPVEITVTVNDTQETKSITLTPYVKATKISFADNLPTLLIKSKVGVTVNNEHYNYSMHTSIDMGLSVIGENNKEATAEPIINVNGDNILTTENGIITLNGNTGTATITATVENEAEPVSISIIVLDFDIVEGGEKITGTQHSMYGEILKGKEYTLTLALTPNKYDSAEAFANLGFTTSWCLNLETGETSTGTGGSTRNMLESANNFSAKFYRNASAYDTDVFSRIYKANQHIATVSFRAIDA